MIFIVFLVPMFFSYIPDLLRGFFGDIRLEIPESGIFGIDEYYKWGVRHYWFFWMCFCLWCLSIVDSCFHIDKAYRKYYDLR